MAVIKCRAPLNLENWQIGARLTSRARRSIVSFTAYRVAEGAPAYALMSEQVLYVPTGERRVNETQVNTVTASVLSRINLSVIRHSSSSSRVVMIIAVCDQDPEGHHGCERCFPKPAPMKTTRRCSTSGPTRRV